MERSFDKVLSKYSGKPNTVGVLISNRQGLCLGAHGAINPNVSGIGMAISEQVSSLEPKLPSPTIILYSGNKRCIIKKDGEITGVIYKEVVAGSASTN